MKETLRSKGEDQYPHPNSQKVYVARIKMGRAHGIDRPSRGFEEYSNTLHPLLEYPSQQSELSLTIEWGIG